MTNKDLEKLENNGMEDLMKNLPDLETIPVAEL